MGSRFHCTSYTASHMWPAFNRVCVPKIHTSRNKLKWMAVFNRWIESFHISLVVLQEPWLPEEMFGTCSNDRGQSSGFQIDRFRISVVSCGGKLRAYSLKIFHKVQKFPDFFYRYGKFEPIAIYAAARRPSAWWFPKWLVVFQIMQEIYISYVHSYAALAAVSLQDYAWVGPQILLLHWAQECVKSAPILVLTRTHHWTLSRSSNTDPLTPVLTLPHTYLCAPHVNYFAMFQIKICMHVYTVMARSSSSTRCDRCHCVTPCFRTRWQAV